VQRIQATCGDGGRYEQQAENEPAHSSKDLLVEVSLQHCAITLALRTTRYEILLRMFWRSPVLFLPALLFAQANSDWDQPFPPHRVIGNIYYVGTKGLASYLITTPQGSILINSSLESSVPLIRASVEKLGFRFQDVKILLINHAHFDHCAGSFLVKELTGAKYMVMEQDVAEVESGGKNDFQYGKTPDTLFKSM
jgi:hypothetical protein